MPLVYNTGVRQDFTTATNSLIIKLSLSLSLSPITDMHSTCVDSLPRSVDSRQAIAPRCPWPEDLACGCPAFNYSTTVAPGTR